MDLRRYAEVWRAIDEGMAQEDLAKHFGGTKALEMVMTVQIKRLKGEID
jgi:hypothetical protein